MGENHFMGHSLAPSVLYLNLVISLCAPQKYRANLFAFDATMQYNIFNVNININININIMKKERDCKYE